MGVGGNFWEILKPYARYEGYDFLRNKKVAIDLSIWIVQHETALRSTDVRNPHLRLTFLRTISLFSKFGAFPIFVVDGKPSPLKHQARISRFFRFSGINSTGLLPIEENISVERNQVFRRCIDECMELLKLLGMPVLQSKGEAEALCAQLNHEEVVDACITTDNDALLFGARCVIKCFSPSSKEPFECYHMDDIEAGLGLQRNHFIAISLLVGNDFDLHGVQRIGLDTALRFVKRFDEAEVLNRLREIGSGMASVCEDGSLTSGENSSRSVQTTPKKTTHCSLCGHPGNKISHQNAACGYCHVDTGCIAKPAAFKCDCHSCEMGRKEREQKKNDNWHLAVCKKISLERNFPNKKIIELYCSNKHATDDALCLSWRSPNAEMLVDFLVYHLPWEPSYVRRRMLPMLSTIFLREMAANPTGTLLLHGQYEFDSIQRVKMRYGHQFYVVRWKKPSHMTGSVNYTTFVEESSAQLMEVEDPVGALDEPDVPEVHVDNGCWFLLTDENMDLVQKAFPDKVQGFSLKKELEDLKRRKRSSSRSEEETPEHCGTQNSNHVQMAITEYYRSTKVVHHAKSVEDKSCGPKSPSVTSSKGTSTSPSGNLPKSVRRRLLFG